MKTYEGLEDGEQEFQFRSECRLCCFVVRKEQRIHFTDETDEDCKLSIPIAVLTLSQAEA